MVKYKLYQFYRTNKNLKIFLNTFLQLSKKVKIDNFQALDILFKKLSNEFKDWLIIIKKAENFNNIILLLHNIDAIIKKISKQSQLRIKPNTTNISDIKPLFKSQNLVSTKFSIIVGVVFPIPNTATKTHLSFINVSNMIRQ